MSNKLKTKSNHQLREIIKVLNTYISRLESITSAQKEVINSMETILYSFQENILEENDQALLVGHIVENSQYLSSRKDEGTLVNSIIKDELLEILQKFKIYRDNPSEEVSKSQENKEITKIAKSVDISKEA